MMLVKICFSNFVFCMMDFIEKPTQSLAKLHVYAQKQSSKANEFTDLARKTTLMYVCWLQTSQDTLRTDLYLPLTGSDWLICSLQSQSVSTQTSLLWGHFGK